MRLLLTTLMLTLVLVSAGCNRRTTPPTPAAIPTEAGAPRAPAATLVPTETGAPAPAGAEQPGEPYPPPDVVATPAGVYPEPEGATPTP